MSDGTLGTLMNDRLEKLKILIENGKDPFRIKNYQVTNEIIDILTKFEKKVETGQHTNKFASIAGRVLAIRRTGKIIFADLHDFSGKIQIVFSLADFEDFEDFNKLLDLGDIIGIEGEIFATKKGELSILVKNGVFLSKCLRPLPKLWTGLKDTDKRYRKRYLDFILNEKVMKNFKIIFRCKQLIRDYLNKEGYIEIGTPILQPLYGGAFANPFTTFHQDLNETMYLRIAPELYLKRLIVGGFSKVYEFASCFRNESIDSTHNPEFSQVEIYIAYGNANTVMELTENVYYHVVKNLFDSEKIEFKDKKIDFSTPWKRISMYDAIIQYGGPDLNSMTSDEIIEYASGLAPKMKFSLAGEAIEFLFDYYVKENLVDPTFITDFPADISPLAKLKEPNSKFADRFELYIGTLECGNGFSELNNPIQQYKRFSEQEQIRQNLGKEGLEYQPMDRDYIRALEYGMPPAGGVGWGLGRFFMLLTNNESLREVIAFPILRTIKKKDIKVVPDYFPDCLDWYP